MHDTYKVTRDGAEAIKAYPWIHSHFKLGKVGSRDSREVVRLLENTHYDHISRTLRRIDRWGKWSGRIGEEILRCNDPFNLSRLLAELHLFVHLYSRLKSGVAVVDRPDISVAMNNYTCLIEVYSPMDFYGYQVFSRLLMSCIKHLPINKGFDVHILSRASSSTYVYDFPEFREVHRWMTRFQKHFLSWIRNAKVGQVYRTKCPASSLELIITLKHFANDPRQRSVAWNQAGMSLDTKLFFEIPDSSVFAGTQWGTKIREKLEKQQAGPPSHEHFRVLAINFSLAETADVSFLTHPRHFSNLEKHIKFLASKIHPYPPYDVVLPCVLGLRCGFAKPVNLSSLDDACVAERLRAMGLDKCIKKARRATDKELEEFTEALKTADNW